MRCLGTALPKRTAPTRFWSVSVSFSSQAKRWGFVKLVTTLQKKKTNKKKRENDILRRMSVLSELKLGFAMRGGRKLFKKVPAKVTLVSWPSFAVAYNWERNKICKKKKTRDLLMLGVMKSHWGILLAARSCSNNVKFLMFAERSGLLATES